MALNSGFFLWGLPWGGVFEQGFSHHFFFFFGFVTLKVFLDSFIRELGNTEKFREEIKHDLWTP